MAKSWGRWKHVGEQPDEGGQARVYKVNDTKSEFEGIYALKELKNPKRLGRFFNEVESIALKENKYLLKIVDSDLEGDKKFYVTKYYNEGTLEQFVSNNEELPFLEKLNICIELAKAISVLHENPNPIIHRDLKPSNIYMSDNRKSVVIGDFGLSFSESQQRQTIENEVVGSRFYMHPDFEDGPIRDVYPKHDLYSLGKIIYFVFSEGKYFNREKHREQDYNLLKHPKLSKDSENLGYYEMINRLLDEMITENPQIVRSARRTIDELMAIKSVVKNKKHALVEKDNFITCDFCGLGKYHSVGTTHDFLTQSGTMTNNPNSRKILVCNYCGHVQIFVFSQGNQKANWYTLE